MARRFAPLHASLTCTSGPVRVLTPMIEGAALPLRNTRHHLALGSGVALARSRDQCAGHIAQAFEELLEALLRWASSLSWREKGGQAV
jgi:hypothetical protein